MKLFWSACFCALIYTLPAQASLPPDPPLTRHHQAIAQGGCGFWLFAHSGSGLPLGSHDSAGGVGGALH